MQTVVLNINESVSEKFFWLLKHFDKSEIEVVDFDTNLEALIDKGFCQLPLKPYSSKVDFSVV